MRNPGQTNAISALLHRCICKAISLDSVVLAQQELCGVPAAIPCPQDGGPVGTDCSPLIETNGLCLFEPTRGRRIFAVTQHVIRRQYVEGKHGEGWVG